MVAFFMFGIVAAIESRTIKASLSAGTNHLFRSAGVVLAAKPTTQLRAVRCKRMCKFSSDFQ